MNACRPSRLVSTLAAAIAAASLSTPSLGQSGRDSQSVPLYRIEVIVFGHTQGNAGEELFSHTAARAALPLTGDLELDTFDFEPYPIATEDALAADGEDASDALENGTRFGRDDTAAGPGSTDGSAGDAVLAGPETSDGGERTAEEGLDRESRVLLGGENEPPSPNGGGSTGPLADDSLGATAGSLRGTDDDATDGLMSGTNGSLSGVDGSFSEGSDPGNSEAGLTAEAPPPDPLGPGNAVAPFRFRLLAPKELRLAAELRRLERLDAYRPLVHGGWIQEGLPLNEAKPFELAYLGANNPAGTIRLHLSRFLHLTLDLMYREETSYSARAALVGATPAGQLQSEAGVEDSIGTPARPFGSEGSPGTRERFGTEGDGWDRGGAMGSAVRQVLADIELPGRYVLQAERRIGSGTVHYFDHPMFGVLVLVEPYEPPARTASDSVGPAA